jgi:5-dehydro-2-deoxygluconokinase
VTAEAAPLDVLTVGRVSVDLYADQPDAGFTDPQRFVKSVGGSPTNVAVAAARLGHHAAVLTKVGADPFGDYVRRKLEELGVDIRFVGRDPELRTPLAFAALTPPDDPELLFYRVPVAPDLMITLDDVDLDVVREVPVFWVTGSALSLEPSTSTVTALLRERSRRRHTVLDLDYRPMFWDSEARARELIGAAAALATVAVGNRMECEIAVGSAEPEEAAGRLLDRGVELAIVKMGRDGVLVATPATTAVVAPRPVEVVCGLGAGDAFGGAVVHGLLSGWDPVRLVEYANAAGAIVASRLMCADAMPDDAEINALVGATHATR